MFLSPELILLGSEKLPTAPPWPNNKPEVIPFTTPSNEALSSYDVVIITYTSAEAQALAAMFGCETIDKWTAYTNNLDKFLPLVTGKQSPFNDDSAWNQRYYHTLALCASVNIGNAKVLLMKSGFHPAYDGPAVPLKSLVAQVVQETGCTVVITTGTGGGIGPITHLGDVNIATTSQWSCTGQFKDQPWAKAKYQCSPLPSGVLTTISPDLLMVNGRKLPGNNALKVWVDGTVTTDEFAMDSEGDPYDLEGYGWQTCDMDDAAVLQALQAYPNVDRFAIRNASDPKIMNEDKEAAKKLAEQIYQEYGGLTTAGSVIACWALINTLFN